MKQFVRKIMSLFVFSRGLRVSIKHGKLQDWFVAKRNLSKEKRNKIIPVDKLAIVAMFKDEAPYLAEWIEFHKMMGVDRFYLFDNESDDNPIDVLMPYIKEGLVIFQRVSDDYLFALKKTYGDMPKNHIAHYLALEQCRNTTKWISIIDIDEFILPKAPYKTIPDFIDSFNNVNQIILGWKCFGSNGHEEMPAGLTIESYTQFGKIPGRRQFKAIVNPRSIVVDENHYHCIVGKTVDENGKKINHGIVNLVPTNSKCPIFHYITRSKKECFLKCIKNSAIHNARYSIEKYFADFNASGFFDESMLEYATEIHKILDE